MNRLDIYNNSKVILERTTPNKIISWVTILIILNILFLISLFIPFNTYYFTLASIKNINNNYYLLLDKCDFPVKKRGDIYIDKSKYRYEVIYIKNENTLLKLNLKDNIKIENNNFIVKILKDRTTFYNILKQKFKERMMK